MHKFLLENCFVPSPISQSYNRVSFVHNEQLWHPLVWQSHPVGTAINHPIAMVFGMPPKLLLISLLLPFLFVGPSMFATNSSQVHSSYPRARHGPEYPRHVISSRLYRVCLVTCVCVCTTGRRISISIGVRTMWEGGGVSHGVFRCDAPAYSSVIGSENEDGYCCLLTLVHTESDS